MEILPMKPQQQPDNHLEKSESQPLHHTKYKIYFIWTPDLHVQFKTIKCLKENIKYCKYLPNKTPKVLTTKKVNKKFKRPYFKKYK